MLGFAECVIKFTVEILSQCAVGPDRIFISIVVSRKLDDVFGYNQDGVVLYVKDTSYITAE